MQSGNWQFIYKAKRYVLERQLTPDEHSRLDAAITFLLHSFEFRDEAWSQAEYNYINDGYSQFRLLPQPLLLPHLRPIYFLWYIS